MQARVGIVDHAQCNLALVRRAFSVDRKPRSWNQCTCACMHAVTNIGLVLCTTIRADWSTVHASCPHAHVGLVVFVHGIGPLIFVPKYIYRIQCVILCTCMYMYMYINYDNHMQAGPLMLVEDLCFDFVRRILCFICTCRGPANPTL